MFSFVGGKEAKLVAAEIDTGYMYLERRKLAFAANLKGSSVRNHDSRNRHNEGMEVLEDHGKLGTPDIAPSKKDGSRLPMAQRCVQPRAADEASRESRTLETHITHR